MIDAIYRILYGEDFIVESVKSIIHAVDRVFICWTDRPWGDAKTTTYMGKDIELPINKKKPYDGWRKRLQSGLARSEKEKVYFEFMHHDQPDNSFTVFANRIFMIHGRPDTLICMEPDHVWMENELFLALREFMNNKYRCAKSRQIELWKGFKWRVPERPNRTGTVFWNMTGLSGLPETGKRAEPRGTDFQTLGAKVHDLGFAVSEESMLRKHLIALAYADRVRDSRPNPLWFERKWKPWTEENQLKDLEIAMGFESHIPFAIPYGGPLPEVLRDRPEEGDTQQGVLPVRGEAALGQHDDDLLREMRGGLHMGSVSEEEQADLGTGLRSEVDLPPEEE